MTDADGGRGRAHLPYGLLFSGCGQRMRTGRVTMSKVFTVFKAEKSKRPIDGGATRGGAPACAIAIAWAFTARLALPSVARGSFWRAKSRGGGRRDRSLPYSPSLERIFGGTRKTPYRPPPSVCRRKWQEMRGVADEDERLCDVRKRNRFF